MSGPIYASLWIRRAWPALCKALFFGVGGGGLKVYYCKKNTLLSLPEIQLLEKFPLP